MPNHSEGREGGINRDLTARVLLLQRAAIPHKAMVTFLRPLISATRFVSQYGNQTQQCSAVLICLG